MKMETKLLHIKSRTGRNFEKNWGKNYKLLWNMWKNMVGWGRKRKVVSKCYLTFSESSMCYKRKQKQEEKKSKFKLAKKRAKTSYRGDMHSAMTAEFRDGRLLKYRYCIQTLILRLNSLLSVSIFQMTWTSLLGTVPGIVINGFSPLGIIISLEALRCFWDNVPSCIYKGIS